MPASCWICQSLLAAAPCVTVDSLSQEGRKAKKKGGRRKAPKTAAIDCFLFYQAAPTGQHSIRRRGRIIEMSRSKECRARKMPENKRTDRK